MCWLEPSLTGRGDLRFVKHLEGIRASRLQCAKAVHVILAHRGDVLLVSLVLTSTTPLHSVVWLFAGRLFFP